MTRARSATPTETFVDEYCQLSQALFPDVRSFEHFKQLQVGMLSEIKRKTLPAIAKIPGESDPQALHHFVAYAPWHMKPLEQRRLKLWQQALAGRAFTLCIDETGDKKKGKTTDYVAHQYIGNLDKLENGMVSVNAYGVMENITFPLIFKVFKPRTRLQSGDTYKTKPELAVEIIEELEQWGFHFDGVLADCADGESGDFVSALEKRKLKDVLAIRSDHGVWLPKGARVRETSWRPFERVLCNGEQQTRFIREIVFGWRRDIRFYLITTDPKTLPKEGTWYGMTNLPGKIQFTVGNTYGLRTWIAYGFKHAKNELGWADYRVTDYPSIERWWELVFCAYTLLSFPCPALQTRKPGTEPQDAHETTPGDRFSEHPWWNPGQGWKNPLNNLRLVLQPFICFCLILPWLLVFDISPLRSGFAELIDLMNLFHASLPT